MQATIGGTISSLSGGSFQNGAMTATFAHLYNECQHGICGHKDSFYREEGETMFDVTSPLKKLTKRTLNIDLPLPSIEYGSVHYRKYDRYYDSSAYPTDPPLTIFPSKDADKYRFKLQLRGCLDNNCHSLKIP